MTYVLLIYRVGGGADPPSAPGEQATLRAHRAMQEDAAARGELLAAVRLDDAPGARTVRRRPGAAGHDVADGPFIETKEWLVGFYLVDCDTADEAAQRAMAICDEGHAIEVRPVTWRWKG
jgi:hypothetical protein